MAIEKFIIDKSDLSALLRGEELAIQPRGNIKGICVEIAGRVTNGDIFTALFGEPTDVGREGFIYKCQPCDGKFLSTTYLDFDWWNASYKAESEEEKENLCDSCTTNGCSFQSGIVRNHCDFYTSQGSEE